MRYFALAGSLATIMALGGCAAAPRPLRYVAVQTPATISPAPVEPSRRIEVSKTRVLPSIRLPVDAAAFLGELQQKAGTPVLRNADLNLTTSVCFLICVNTDVATAEVAGSDSR